MSLRDFVQLDLVAKGIEHVGPSPAGDGVGLFEGRTGRAQRLHGRVEAVYAEGEASACMRAEVALGREMTVAGWRRVPDARPLARPDRTAEPDRSERVAVHRP